MDLLNELGKRYKMQGLSSILSPFFAISLINSILKYRGVNVLDSILLYDTKMVLKSCF